VFCQNILGLPMQIPSNLNLSDVPHCFAFSPCCQLLAYNVWFTVWSCLWSTGLLVYVRTTFYVLFIIARHQTRHVTRCVRCRHFVIIPCAQKQFRTNIYTFFLKLFPFHHFRTWIKSHCSRVRLKVSRILHVVMSDLGK